MKFLASVSTPPLGAVLVVKFLRDKNIDVVWGKETSLEVSSTTTLDSSVNISRYLSQLASELSVSKEDVMKNTEIDHWLSYSLGPLTSSQEFEAALNYLEAFLSCTTYLVGDKLTIADLNVLSSLILNQNWQKIKNKDEAFPNVSKWVQFISNIPDVAVTLQNLPEDIVVGKALQKEMISNEPKEEGKFVDLPDAEMGKVVVRFPPEASGYLHIGHAKAALLNWYYRELFEGKFIMRFDDTNPDKEKVDFEKVILEDVKLLEISPDIFTHTSDHFPLLLELCEGMLRSGKAYCDDTPPEEMKAEREARKPSRNRDNTVEKNFAMWAEMIRGTDFGQKCCVRAKIDMASDNGCMRDPTIYRCKNEPHPKTGSTYKVYPTYDFACPVVDSVEGVTHALRTMEYHDRDDQYYWFIDALNLRKPHIWEYSRLNMMNTVLSKRKLTWFVEEGLVDSWEDPRLPTVRGVLRRGMTVQGLKQFIIAQGSSRSVVQMEWDKIWAFNKKVIDPIAPRYTALEAKQTVVVNVKGASDGTLIVPKHPKNEKIGTKTIKIGSKVLISKEDVSLLKCGENATFINWGNLKIVQINDGGTIEADLNIGNTDYKKTPKLTWLCCDSLTPVQVIYYDHIITKPVLGKDEDFKQYINHNSKKIVDYIGDPQLATLAVGEIIQLQRIGFFRVDKAASTETPVVLIHIPDGSSKGPSTSGASQLTSGNSVALSSKDIEEIAVKWREDRTAFVENSSQIGNKGNSKQVRSLKSDKAETGEIKSSARKDQTGKGKTPSQVPAQATSSPELTNSEEELNGKITELGDKIRALKSSKAEKSLIDEQVKILLSLKAQYKTVSGKEWKPGVNQPQAAVKAIPSQPSNSESELNAKISDQGDRVRSLKSSKADKSLIEEQVKILLTLKAEFKTLTGKDWQPSKKEEVNHNSPSNQPNQLNEKIVAQGNKVRQLKTNKAEKALIDAEVQNLLALKSEYKKATGQDWKPDSSQPLPVIEKSPKMPSPSTDVSAVLDKIAQQGDKIRELKSAKAEKAVIDAEVSSLLALKAEYKNITGEEWKAPGARSVPAKKPVVKKVDKKVEEKKEKETSVEKDDEKGGRKQTRLCLEARKEENLPDWYSQVITKGEMIEYYDVSGCYILRPWAFAIWEAIQSFIDKEIKKLGVVNTYFPMFVSKTVLEREKAHIADFAPEVAWVTKSGDSDLAEHIAIRPTSETVMYPAYSKWIKSYRDLPLRLNQWNNVVRWEFKHPQPFLRTREFLWQEGHTAFATYKEAEEEVYQILDLYARVYTDLLAIPVVKGRKTEKEKFAGGDFTTTVEAFVSASGRGIQGATSHHLGQNFSKMFDIVFEDPETKEKTFVYQNSWGLTTRTIGVMIMVHGDNKGLVLPPAISVFQVVIVPCGISASLPENIRLDLINSCKKLDEDLRAAGLRSKLDDRDNYSPGWRFNHWELKGVPLRVEFGPKDLEKKQLVAVRRDNGEKVTLALNGVVESIRGLLDNIQGTLLARAEADLKEHTKIVTKWADFSVILDANNVILAPFCEDESCEEKIKKDSARDQDLEPGAPSMGAKSLCIPFDQPALIKPGEKCIHPSCGRQAKSYTLFGRSY